MKLENMVEGQVLYSLDRRKMGNTTISTVSVHPITVIKIDLLGDRVLASWNGNTPRWQPRNRAEKWLAKKPIMVTTAVGAQRRATREEIKAMKEQSALKEANV